MDDIKSITGRIFNIQHYSIHDGPGIRTNIFLKGCPLRCLWCQNPESQSLKDQLMFYPDKCTGCGTCVNICPGSAVKLIDCHAKTDRKLCKGCGKCVKACVHEARSIMGKEISAGEAFSQVEQDKLFYDTSGGGVTITGGEVLSQPSFTRAILQLCKESNINTAIETCGYAKWEILKSVLEYTDLVLYDVKHMDTVEHKKCTGVGNELIISNLKRLSNELNIPVILRTPVVPGYNASKENINAMAKFIKEEIPTCIEVNLLPYHNLGEGKLSQLELENTNFKSFSPSDEEMMKLKEIVKGYGLMVK